jgi:hypothetical protein
MSLSQGFENEMSKFISACGSFAIPLQTTQGINMQKEKMCKKI